MRLSIPIDQDKEYLYWKLLELKTKYRARRWIDLLELMIDAIEALEKNER